MKEKTLQERLSDDSSLLHRFDCKIREIFHPSLKLLEQEEILQGIVQSVLDAQDTVIHTPFAGPYYLVNERLHYTVRIGQGSVTVVNTYHTVARDVPIGVTDILRTRVDEKIQERLKALDESILQGEKKILEAILNNEESTHKVTAGSKTVFHQ